MKRCKLTKVKSLNQEPNHFAVRTDTVEGDCDGGVPLPGTHFTMVAESLTPGGIMRLVRTSEIQKTEFTGPNSYRFETLNTVYELEIYG